jgi:hypothetical protein
MRKETIFVLLGCMLLAGVLLTEGQAPTQYPIADKVADKVIQKYQTSTCEQLRAKKQEPPQPPSAMEVKAIEQLRKDPQMRQHFLDKIAGPVANKLFECGMIP